jgi:bifunctional polynucleotide phosphatase/kinase
MEFITTTNTTNTKNTKNTNTASPAIYNLHNAVYREKMASFDYDWTLVNPKDGKTFPKDVDDWEWMYPEIPEKIKKYYEDGFMIVIFTNQSKQWKHDQILLVATTLEIPMFIVIATDKKDYKPNPILFNELLKENKIDKEHSFFVGDALGRKSDFSDSDKVFAENIGISCYSPEQVLRDKRPVLLLPSEETKELICFKEKQIVIMMGYPGSGKTTIAQTICKNNTDVIYIDGDTYKTSAKMIKTSLEYIKLNKSIIFDATNSSRKKRKEYVDLAKKYNYKVACIHVSTPLDISYKRNKLRDAEKHVPKIAYSVYSKHYEKPDEQEGFHLIVV